MKCTLLLLTLMLTTVIGQQCISDLVLMKKFSKSSLDRNILQNLLVERVPGTKGHQKVSDYIVEYLKSIPGMQVETHNFVSKTPLGSKRFRNIIGTLSGEHSSNGRYVFSCHYDSKYFENEKFLGATDSAVPCTMLLQIAKQVESVKRSIALEFIFFDGEEAFHQWSDTDSLYGSRELAHEYLRLPCNAIFKEQNSIIRSKKLCNERNRLSEIKLFVLLDLLGSSDPWPEIHDYYPESSDSYRQIMNLETRLSNLELLSLRRLESRKRYFLKRREDLLIKRNQLPQIADDHQPFHKMGVKVLHIITYPFPTVWHTTKDDETALDFEVADDFLRIISAFIHELL